MTDRDSQVVDATTSTVHAGGPKGSLPPPLRMLRDRADRFLITRLRIVFDHVDDTFFDLADSAESHGQQTHYFDAMRLIRVERKAIENAFQRTIASAFDALVANPNTSSAKPEEYNDSFELVADDELEEIIALDTMVSKSEESYRKELQTLIRRLDTLAIDSVSSKNNPLGPDTICDAFFKATDGLDIGIRSKLVLLKLFDRHVMASLGEFLHQSNQLLDELGVLPKQNARKRQSPPPRPNIQKARDTGEIAQPQAAETRASESPHKTTVQPHDYGRLVNQLNSVLSRFTGGAEEKPQEGGAFAELEDVLNAVTALQMNSLMGGISSEHSLVEALNEQLGNDKSGAQIHSTQRAVVNLVDSMFTRVRKEQGFSHALEPEMLDLEMAIMKVALKDPSFFDKERHPARRLLNEVAQAAVGFDVEDALSEDPLYLKINEVLVQLQNVAADHATLTRLLTDFIAFVEKERRRSVTKEQRLLEEEGAKARLNFSHNVVKQTLENRLVGMELPQITVSFVEQAWGKVLFLAHLREGESSDVWRASSQILDEVVDLSVLGKEAFPIRRALQLLKSIRNKLEEVALDPYQTEHLIRGMEQLIQAGVAGNSSDIERVKVEALYPSIPGEPSLDDKESEQQNVAESDLHDIESIKRGSWVEFTFDGDVKHRARFAGTVGPTDKLIFVNRRGGKVAEGSRRRLAVELKNERLVILDNSPLFDRALSGVVSDVRNRKVSVK